MINLAGVLFEDSFGSINLFRANFFEDPVTKKVIFDEADKTFGFNYILLSPFPNAFVINSLLFISTYGNRDAV